VGIGFTNVQAMHDRKSRGTVGTRPPEFGMGTLMRMIVPTDYVMFQMSGTRLLALYIYNANT